MNRFVATLILVLALPAVAPAAGGGERRADMRRQASHYLRKGMVERARAVIRRAVMLPGARDDAALQILAARVYLESGDIEKAFIALDRAEASDSADVAQKAGDLAKSVRADFGEVRIFPEGRGHRRGRLFVEARRPLIGLAKKRAFAQAQAALAAKERSYPATVFLPWGAFQANGAAFDHRAGQKTQVTAPFPRVAVFRPAKDPVAIDIVDAFEKGIGGQVEIFDSSDRRRVEAAARSLHERRPSVILGVGDHAALAARSRLSSVPLVQVRTKRADISEAVDGARGLGMEAFAVRVLGIDDVDEALEELEDVDAYWLMEGVGANDRGVFVRVARAALAARRPLVGSRYDESRDGALMSVEPDPGAEGTAAATLARQVLWGQDPPAERTIRPSGVRWTINRKVAILLGLDLPHVAIRDAWRVINTAPPEEVAGSRSMEE